MGFGVVFSRRSSGLVGTRLGIWMGGIVGRLRGGRGGGVDGSCGTDITGSGGMSTARRGRPSWRSFYGKISLIVTCTIRWRNIQKG